MPLWFPSSFCVPVVWCQVQQSRRKWSPAREGCCMRAASHFPSCLFTCLQSHGKPVGSHSLLFASLDRICHVSICLNAAAKCIPSAFSPYAPTDFPCIYSDQWSSIWSVGLWPALGKDCFGVSAASRKLCLMDADNYGYRKCRCRRKPPVLFI